MGFKGAEEVKKHPFFKNEQWNFNTIRHAVPPIVHDLSGDDDTRNFDDVENEAPIENFPTPKAFAGNHLPFVGFTYSKDYQLLTDHGEKAPPPIPDRVSATRSRINNNNNKVEVCRQTENVHLFPISECPIVREFGRRSFGFERAIVPGAGTQRRGQ